MKKLLYQAQIFLLIISHRITSHIECNIIGNNRQNKPQDSHFKSTPNYPKIIKKLVYFAVIFFGFSLIIHPLAIKFNLATITVTYIFLMIIVTRSRGLISALISALMSAFALDFFFIPPIYSFAIENKAYITTMGIMVLAGVIIYLTNGNLRYQISQLVKAKNKKQLFYEARNELAAAMTYKQLLDVVTCYFPRIFNAKYMLLLPEQSNNLLLKSGNRISGFDENIAQWAFINNQNVGLNTNTFTHSKLLYLPILLSIHSKGIMVVKPENTTIFFLPGTQYLLNNFIRHLAITIERIHFTQIALQLDTSLFKQKHNAIYR